MLRREARNCDTQAASRFDNSRLIWEAYRYLSLMSIAEQTAAYRAATAEFLQAVSELSESDLDLAVEGQWSARQIIHHVADSEAQSYARLRRLIAEPGTQIQGYDEGGWGENTTLGYKDLPIASSVAVFEAVREASAIVFARLTDSQLALSGIHSESGEYSIATWIDTYTRHPREHVDQIRSVVAAAKK